MKRGTGGIIGPQNSSTSSTASGTWALWEQQKSQQQLIWPAITPANDSFWQYVILLLTGSGTNNSNNNTFIDSSGTVTVTATGSPIQGSYNPYENGYFSNYFDGSSDYIRRSGSGVLTASADLTIEFWVFSLSTSVIGLFDGGPGQTSILRQYPTNKIGKQGGAEVSFTLNANTWYHIAFTNNSIGGIGTIYVNGTSVSTNTFGGYSAGSNFDIGAINGGGDGSFNGYISNFRVTNSLVYSGNFTPPTTPLNYLSSTTLLTCQSNRFIDNSINNNSLSVNNDVFAEKFSPFTAQTALLPKSYSSYFAGTAYLSAANNASIQLSGVSNYTIEFWAYMPTASSLYGLFNKGSDYGLDNDSNRFVYRVGGANAFVINGGLDVGAWTHIALVQTPSGVILYKNGTSIGSSGAASISNSSSSLFIGYCSTGSGTYFNGYISNFRIVKGTAVYTSNFTVPTSPLTNITNTGILTCQSNYVVDNSSNNIGFTYVNNTYPQLLNPFGFNSISQSSYVATDFGGSIYFNGSTDYLETGSGNSVSFGAGDFTIEGWIFWKTINSESAVLLGSNVGWVLYIYPANKLQWGRVSPQSPANLLTGSTTLIANRWYHIAITRKSNNLQMWVNGVLDGSTTDSANYSATGSLRVAISHSGQYFNGYMSNLRIIKGTAIYTAPFMPPLQPLTNVTNTTTLLNGTNANIIDYSSINNVSTTGGAIISASQSKWGTGSLYFNGTSSYLSVLNQISDYLQSSNWTIEFWVYPNVSTGCVLYLNGNTSTFAALRIDLTSNAISILSSANGSSWSLNTGNVGNVPINTWTYITLVKNSTSLVVYINGVSTGTTFTISSSLYTGTLNYIGAYNNGSATSFFNGYVQDLRITKYPRYLSNFAVPSGPPALF